MKTPTQGAATSIHLASSTELRGVSGRFYAKGREARSNKASYDIDAARRLWRVSADLVGIPDVR
jgi:hypothetical protein